MLSIIMYGTLISIACVFFCGVGIVFYKRYKCYKLLKKLKRLVGHKIELLPLLIHIVSNHKNKEERYLNQVIAAKTDLIEAIVGMNSRGIFYTQSFIHHNIVFKNRLNVLLTNLDKYPDIRKKEEMQYLKNEFIELDNQISLTRFSFNEAVGKYNTQLLMFPTNFIAKMFLFQRVQTFVTK